MPRFEVPLKKDADILAAPAMVADGIDSVGVSDDNMKDFPWRFVAERRADACVPVAALPQTAGVVELGNTADTGKRPSGTTVERHNVAEASRTRSDLNRAEARGNQTGGIHLARRGSATAGASQINKSPVQPLVSVGSAPLRSLPGHR